MRSRTLLVAGVSAALLALAGCGSTVAGTPTAAGGGNTGGGTSQKITTVSDLGAIVQHNASSKNSAHVTMAMNVGGMGAINATGDM